MATHNMEQLLELTSLTNTSTRGATLREDKLEPDRLLQGHGCRRDPQGPGREGGRGGVGPAPWAGTRKGRTGPGLLAGACGVQTYCAPSRGVQSRKAPPRAGPENSGWQGAVGARQHPQRRARSLLKQVGAQSEAARDSGRVLPLRRRLPGLSQRPGRDLRGAGGEEEAGLGPSSV